MYRNGYYVKKTKDNSDEIVKLKNELTVKPYGPPQFMKDEKPFGVYQETDEYLIIPKYFAKEKLGKELDKIKYKKNKSKLKFTKELREYQNEIVETSLNKLKTGKGGLISLPCGQGKTVISLYLACQLKKKTLVIVHKSFLMNQWRERIEQFTNAKIGEIRQDKIEVEDCDIVIGMLQSISKDKYTEELFKQFGLVIFDEAHHAPSRYFSRALPIISSEYMLALSATPKRADRLEKIIHWYFGPIIYQIKDNRKINVLVKMYNYHTSHKSFKESMMAYGTEVNRPRTITKIVKLKKRNKFIVGLIKELYEEEGRKILILSDRIIHLEMLKELLDKEKLTDNDYYIGKMKQKDLDESSKRKIILGTYSMASEALDIPELNTLFMVTSRRSIEQSVGRILRKPDGLIQPIIVDINDKLDCFDRQGSFRRNYYRKKGYEIMIYDMNDNEIVDSYEDKGKKSFKAKEFKKIDLDDVDFVD